MFTTTIATDVGYVTLNHHSDWSGEVFIRWQIPGQEKPREFSIPGALLTALGRHAARDEITRAVINTLETFDV